MLDIKLIRENPDKMNELLKRRNPELSIDEVIKIDEERRKIQTQADELRAKRKSESQKIGMMKKNGENTDAIQEEVRQLGDEIKGLEDKQNELDAKQKDILLHIPNIPDETTPIGTSEDDDCYKVITSVENFQSVVEGLEAEGFKSTTAEFTRIPQNMIEITDVKTATSVMRLIDRLEELDDVQNVYANCDIPDNVLQQVEV